MKNNVVRYGCTWGECPDDLAIEFSMIRKGGTRKLPSGKVVGNGLAFHFKRAIEILWPEIVWHKWVHLFIDNYLTHRTMVVIGPASSGKTCTAAFTVLLDYYVFPSQTTIIVCSTTKERLEDRIFGEIKHFHKLAKECRVWIPGHLIEGRQRIITSGSDDVEEGRDFRNGLVGVPCMRGGSYEGLGSFAGLKNKRMRLVGDELSILPRIFVDAFSNLDKNPDFKGIGMGNPKDTLDALGVMAEPAAHLGGWDGGIDQQPVTKVWETRRPDGVALQLVGSDSPNLDGKLGIPLLTQEQIDRDVAFYGKESLWYTMMNQGMMPRGQGAKRVITRQMCLKFHAMEEPLWANSKRTWIAFLDAAYSSVGGDRCVFGVLSFGEESKPLVENGQLNAAGLVNQPPPDSVKRLILALHETMVVPITDQIKNMPEDQIVQFVMNQCSQRNIAPENFFFDSGMRTSLVQSFSRLWSNQVQSIDCGGKPSERNVSHDINIPAREYYSKRITELWYTVRKTIESGQFRGMTEDVMQEMCLREWGTVMGNKIEVEPKAKMKLKSGRSPDLGDALAIGVEGAVQRGFIVRRLKSDRAAAVTPDDRWKFEARAKSKKFWKAGELTPD